MIYRVYSMRQSSQLKNQIADDFTFYSFKNMMNIIFNLEPETSWDGKFIVPCRLEGST